MSIRCGKNNKQLGWEGLEVVESVGPDPEANVAETECEVPASSHCTGDAHKSISRTMLEEAGAQ